MRELMTTMLDVLGLLLIAAGAAAATYPLIGWAALAPGGIVILGASAWAARQARRTGAGGST